MQDISKQLLIWVSAKYHRTSMTWGSNLLEMHILEKLITIIHFVVINLKEKFKAKVHMYVLSWINGAVLTPLDTNQEEPSMFSIL